MEKFAFLFPGQGTQFIQMGKIFYEHYLVAKQTFEEASKVAGQDIAQMCFNGSFTNINKFTNMQLAIVTTEVSIFRTYMDDYGVPPQFLIGHSIGEYAALVCSGALDFSDCIKILLKRGALVERVIDKKQGKMTIIEGISESQLRDAIYNTGLTDEVTISCYNSPVQFAISGGNGSLDALENKLVKMNAAVTPLLHSPPLHSPLMEMIKQEFFLFLQSIPFHIFQYPVISNLTGRPTTNPHDMAIMLSEHLTHPVQFTKSIEYSLGFGVQSIVEMSPKRLLSLFVNAIAPNVNTYCYGLEKDRELLRTHFQSDENYVKDMPNLLGAYLCLLASTRNNNPDNDNRRVSEIYNQIKKEYLNQDKNKIGMSVNQYGQLLELVIEALKIKCLPEEEIKEEIRAMLLRTNKMYTYDNILQRI